MTKINIEEKLFSRILTDQEDLKLIMKNIFKMRAKFNKFHVVIVMRYLYL